MLVESGGESHTTGGGDQANAVPPNSPPGGGKRRWKANHVGPRTLPLFRRLLGEQAWDRLSPSIRDRFAADLTPGRPTWFEGTMTEVRRSMAGAILAHLCRLIGTPLAPFAGRDVPVRVKVHADPKADGAIWERRYRFPGRRPVTVVSTKKYDMRAGLMECVGGGLGMTLAISERDGALSFVSRRYFWRIGMLRLPVPHLLTPGVTHVVHSEVGNGWFRFTMRIHHPFLGETFYQDGLFYETGEG